MHGRASRNAGHRGRRNAEPFAAYDDDAAADATANNFFNESSTLLPSLADRVAVPRGEQRWLRFDSHGNASYIEKVDKHALVTSLQLPARDLVMVSKRLRRLVRFFFLKNRKTEKKKPKNPLVVFPSFSSSKTGQPARAHPDPAGHPHPRARARRGPGRASDGHW